MLIICLSTKFGFNYISDSFFYIFVPQAVDKGIEHKNHDGKKHSSHFDQEPGAFGVGDTVEKQDDPMENGDSC